MSLRFFVARPADAVAVTAIINEAYRVEEFFVAGGRTTLPEVQSLITRGSVLAAECEGRLVGAVEVAVEEAAGSFGMLSTASRLQGRGIGRAMVGAAEDFCGKRSCKSMEISVVNLRSELPPWYRRLGYREVGTEPFPDPARLRRPAHFIIMSKALDFGGATMEESK